MFKLIIKYKCVIGLNIRLRLLPFSTYNASEGPLKNEVELVFNCCAHVSI